MILNKLEKVYGLKIVVIALCLSLSWPCYDTVCQQMRIDETRIRGKQGKRKEKEGDQKEERIREETNERNIKDPRKYVRFNQRLGIPNCGLQCIEQPFVSNSPATFQFLYMHCCIHARVATLFAYSVYYCGRPQWSRLQLF